MRVIYIILHHLYFMKYFWNMNLRENRISYVQTYIFIFSFSSFNIICMNIFKIFDWWCILVKASSLLSFLYSSIADSKSSMYMTISSFLCHLSSIRSTNLVLLPARYKLLLYAHHSYTVRLTASCLG